MMFKASIHASMHALAPWVTLWRSCGHEAKIWEENEMSLGCGVVPQAPLSGLERLSLAPIFFYAARTIMPILLELRASPRFKFPSRPYSYFLTIAVGRPRAVASPP
eukprot:scaffold212303_cov17-Tisochrysis_lutea.AAC.2